MRGFHKYITLGVRTPGSAQEVFGGGGGGGGGLLDFKVYLSPLLGEGDRSRIERLREGFREREREGRVKEGEGERERGREGETRGGRLRQLNGSCLTLLWWWC